jgi:hypothetical protein
MTGRDRIALMVVVSVVSVVAFWFLALAPKRQEAASLGAQVTEQQQRLTAARSNLTASQVARSSYAVNYAAVAQLGKAVPANDDIPSLVYQLDSTAKGSGVNFQVIKLTGAGAAAPAPAPATPAPPASGDSGAQAASATTPAAPTQAATAALPPGAVVGPAGIATMPLEFSFNGSFPRLSTFFGRLDGFIRPRPTGVDARGRLLTINAFSLKFSNKGYPHLKATVNATAYLLPADEGLLAGASPSAPAQGGVQPVANTAPVNPTAPATVTP